MANARQIGRKLREDLSKICRDVMLTAADAVTNSTPVDTTNAANNWILSTGRPNMLVDGSREAPSHAMQDAGIEKIQSYDVGRDGKIFLRNNVFYLQFLDQGHSQQAPAGFVAAALQTGARRAPRGRVGDARKMLRGMARKAYVKGF